MVLVKSLLEALYYAVLMCSKKEIRKDGYFKIPGFQNPCTSVC